MNKLDRVLQDLAAIKPAVMATQAHIEGMREDIQEIRITSATQGKDIEANTQDIASLREKLGKAFVKIEDHTAEHWKFYAGTVGLVAAVVGIAMAI